MPFVPSGRVSQDKQQLALPVAKARGSMTRHLSLQGSLGDKEMAAGRAERPHLRSYISVWILALSSLCKLEDLLGALIS